MKERSFLNKKVQGFRRGRVKIVLTVLFVLITAGSVFSERSFRYEAKGNRDPFVPLVSETGSYVSDAYGISGIKDIRLEGIVWDETKGSIAIINGEIVKEGQEIGSVKVLKIQKDGVIFNVDNEAVKIDLRTD